jgi:hypothetical protein
MEREEMKIEKLGKGAIGKKARHVVGQPISVARQTFQLEPR